MRRAVGPGRNATVAEVRERLADKTRYTNVCSRSSGLSRQGVRRAHRGRAARIATTRWSSAEAAGRNALRRLVDKVFQGSPKLLMTISFRQESEATRAAAAPQTPRSAASRECQVIAVWMLYCLGIGLAFVIVGQRRSTRGLPPRGPRDAVGVGYRDRGSYLVPVPPGCVRSIRPRLQHRFRSSLSPDQACRPPEPLPTDQPPPIRRFLSPISDRPPALAWMIASLALILFVGVGARRLIALRRRWRPATSDGRNVLISPRWVPLWSVCGRPASCSGMGHWTFSA